MHNLGSKRRQETIQEVNCRWKGLDCNDKSNTNFTIGKNSDADHKWQVGGGTNAKMNIRDHFIDKIHNVKTSVRASHVVSTHKLNQSSRIVARFDFHLLERTRSFASLSL